VQSHSRLLRFIPTKGYFARNAVWTYENEYLRGRIGVILTAVDRQKVKWQWTIIENLRNEPRVIRRKVAKFPELMGELLRAFNYQVSGF